MGVREGKETGKTRSRLKVSSVGELTISIRSLFHEMGSLTENAAFLRSRRKLRWRNLKSCPRRSRSVGASKNSACGKSKRPWNMLKAKMRSPRSRGRSREKIFSRRSLSSYGNYLMPLTIRVARRCMRSIRAMSRRRYGEDACWPFSRIGLTSARYRGRKISGVKTAKPRRSRNRIRRARFAAC